MAGLVRTLLMQHFWWLARADRNSMGFTKGAPWTRRVQAEHAKRRREARLGILTGGTDFPNIIDLHVFWLNERCRRTVVAKDPDPAWADVLWVYAQDPLTPEARTTIERAIAAARPGTRIVNRPEVYDFYYRPDAFSVLAAAGLPVPQTAFTPADAGRPVLWKPNRRQSTTIGPEPYREDRPGWRAFGYVDARGAQGLHWRYRILHFCGTLFQCTAMAAPEPIVRYKNAAVLDRTWLATAEEVRHVHTIARASGLDFFAVDFLRRAGDGSPVFTDINVFPMFKDIQARSDRYGHRHDFDIIRPVEAGGRSPWDVADDLVAEAARLQRVDAASA